jgi:hypothetical protein
MDGLERKLIELNQALLRLAAGQKPTEKLIEEAQNALAGASMNFDMGSGNDTVIINNGGNNCEPNGVGFTGSQGFAGSQGFTGSQGPIGFTGSQGPIGFTGSQGPIGFTGSAGVCQCEDDCNSIVISEDYQASCNNYYIGVNSEEAVTITLPADCETCCELVIKAEMGPPLGNSKVTIVTENGALIDGKDDYVITVPYGAVRLICSNGDWFVI